MEFVTQRDIEASQDQVFEAMCDFSAFERQALRSGIDVVRTSGDAPPGTATSWRLQFEFYNRPLTLDARIASFDPPGGYTIRGTGNGFQMNAVAEFLALSRSVTRLTVRAELVPRSMSMRIAVQSLRLVRGRVQGALDRRMEALAQDIEARGRAGA